VKLNAPTASAATIATIKLMRINMARFVFAHRLNVRAKSVNATFYDKNTSSKSASLTPANAGFTAY
jgi:hypothetical protein